MLFMLEQAWSMLSSLTKYYLAFAFFYCGGSLDKCTLFGGRRLPAVHMFTLAQTILLWDAPHYRAISFSNDLKDNVRNIAIPGTGDNPMTHSDLHVQHWFAIWRHNCLLMGWHELLTNSSGYRLEDKGTFLLDGAQLGLPVSPFFEDTPAMFIKHKSIEGGMGVHVFKNFAHGGDWIFQKALTNSSFLSSMLPPGAPLSTLRIVTASIFWLEEWQRQPSQVHAQSLQLTTAFLHRHEQRMAGHESQRKDNLVAAPADNVHHSSGSSSGGNEMRTSRRPLALSISADGVWRPGPLTPPLPMSAGVVTRRIHTEGRDGQFIDAVKSLTAQGLTDPALGTGLTEDGINSISTRRTMSADSHQQSASAGGPAALAAETNQAAAAADILSSSPQRQDQHHASDAAALEEDNLAYAGQVEVVTAVWRAGLAGACTDHSCVCFAIDPDTGELQQGVTANHWNQLGLEGVGRVATAAQQVHTAHPESGQQVTGRIIPNMAEVLDVVVQAHVVAAPDLPLIGWDVALTSEGVSILEVNLSCNLFNGSFDKEGYYEFMYQYLTSLQQMQRQRAAQHSRKANHI
eukprot:gene12744-12873_t